MTSAVVAVPIRWLPTDPGRGRTRVV